MTFRKPIITAALCATAVAGASVAEAATRQGSFRGQTKAKDPVGLSVTSSNNVRAFYFEGVRLKCDDTDSFFTSRGGDRNHSPKAARYTIKSTRRFTIHRTSTRNGFGWTAKGRFSSKGGSASGTLRVLARFNVENELDPKGSIRCSSGLLSWTAKRH